MGFGVLFPFVSFAYNIIVQMGFIDIINYVCSLKLNVVIIYFRRGSELLEDIKINSSIKGEYIIEAI